MKQWPPGARSFPDLNFDDALSQLWDIHPGPDNWCLKWRDPLVHLLSNDVCL